MVMPNRTFGVEIEVARLGPESAADALNAAGIECHDLHYDHEDRPYWKIVEDCSVSGCEVVSPILRGVEGLRQIKKVMKVLSQAGALVDSQCGLHVHVGCEDLSAAEIISVVKRYVKYETVIDSMMPRSRRGDGNTYCHSNRGSISSLDSILARDGHFYDVVARQGSRFVKVNLCAFFNYGTIEFRQHAGTLNGKKISNWIKFLLNFIESSKEFASVDTCGETFNDMLQNIQAAIIREGTISARGLQRELRVQNTLCVDTIEIILRKHCPNFRFSHEYNVQSNEHVFTYLGQENNQANSVVTIPSARADNVGAERVEHRRAARRLSSAQDDSVWVGIPANVKTYLEARIAELASRNT